MLSEATSGLKHRRRFRAFLDRHGHCAAGRDVDHRVTALLDHLQERRERLERLVWLARLRIARV
jgi:hypothetical protein